MDTPISSSDLVGAQAGLQGPIMDGTMDYRVPVAELPVHLALAGAEPAHYIVYLSPYSDRHDGAEHVDECLNDSRQFLPVSRDGIRQILSKEQMIWLRIPLTPEGRADERMAGTQKRAIVELSDGTRLEGELRIDRPDYQSRISDVLNDVKERFVRLDRDGGAYFLNKSYIRLALPAD